MTNIETTPNTEHYLTSYANTIHTLGREALAGVRDSMITTAAVGAAIVSLAVAGVYMGKKGKGEEETPIHDAIQAGFPESTTETSTDNPVVLKWPDGHRGIARG